MFLYRYYTRDDEQPNLRDSNGNMKSVIWFAACSFERQNNDTLDWWCIYVLTIADQTATVKAGIDVGVSTH